MKYLKASEVFELLTDYLKFDYIAQDAWGQWYAFRTEPVKALYNWKTINKNSEEDGVLIYLNIEYEGNWVNSLHFRYEERK